METKSKSRAWLIILILAAVAFLALVLMLGYRYMAFRLEANISPPQVLIHQPYNQEFVYERDRNHSPCHSKVGRWRLAHRVMGGW